MMDLIKVKLFLFLHRICKLLKISIYFSTKYGIKALNKPAIHIETKTFLISEIPINNIYLGFDGLKDNYTLLGTNIINSPHRHLMELLSNNDNISNCDYILREKKGCLDGRYAIYINDYIIKAHERAFKNCDYINRLPIVYQIDEKYYILDGKHRIATESLTYDFIKCKIIDLQYLSADKYTKELFEQCRKNSSFKINEDHLKKIIKG